MLSTINRKQNGGKAFLYMAASTIFQTLYGNQPYMEEAILLNITLYNMVI